MDIIKTISIYFTSSYQLIDSKVINSHSSLYITFNPLSRVIFVETFIMLYLHSEASSRTPPRLITSSFCITVKTASHCRSRLCKNAALLSTRVKVVRIEVKLTLYISHNSTRISMLVGFSVHTFYYVRVTFIQNFVKNKSKNICKFFLI